MVYILVNLINIRLLYKNTEIIQIYTKKDNFKNRIFNSH
jgi:hypothetical protein